MIEAFYSGKAGLTAHQNSMDVIANNIANVNTTAYKTKKQDFGSLLSVSEVRPETENSDNLIAGAGSKTGIIKTDMSSGAAKQTESPTDYYIDGEGFFAVRDNAGNVYYTRDGSFRMMREGNGWVLGTADGMTVLDINGRPIGADANGPVTTPGIFTFPNVEGLLSDGGNLFEATAISGNAVATDKMPQTHKLEESNVDLAEQMIGLITSQRGFQLNSSVITTANEIEGMVNELGR